jgi:hypothetical protein
LAVPVLAIPAFALAVPALAGAEEIYRHGRVRYTEAGVSIQRATEPGAEEAVPNMPFLPGDRVWNDADGRVEFQFADGTYLRLDRGSKLDYVAHEEGDDERLILRLWSGSLVLHSLDSRRSPEFALETPGGVVVAGQRGVCRVDVEAGETRVSVYEGEVALEADRRLTVRAGERVWARGGEAYGDPEAFSRADLDDFGRWDAERHGQVRMVRDVPDYVPEDVSPYASELEDHGAWYFDAGIGHVWRPYVDASWRPYHNGRWMWTSYGWTWLPYERWGWAPFHYGRWGHAPALGWYWVPGRAWSPAWVDWASGGDYVGWCPTGWRDGYIAGQARDRGWAVPRGTRNAWVYARRGDLGVRDLARRVALDMNPPRNMTLLEPQSRLARDLSVVSASAVASAGVRARAVPRNVQRRPGPGDTTPELGGDPAVGIPPSAARRRSRPTAWPPDTAAGVSDDGAGAPQQVAPAPTPPEASTPFPWTARPRPGRRGESNANETDRPAPETDRDVLRPVFRPLSRPRADVERQRGEAVEPAARQESEVQAERGARRRGAGRPDEGSGFESRPPRVERSAPEADRSAPRPERSAPRPERAEPRREGPPPGGAAATPRPPGGGDHAARRKRDN